MKSPLDNWIGFISGVTGFGFVNIQFSWQDEGLKLCVAGAVAFIAGIMGVAGKYFFIWARKEILLKFKK